MVKLVGWVTGVWARYWTGVWGKYFLGWFTPVVKCEGCGAIYEDITSQPFGSQWCPNHLMVRSDGKRACYYVRYNSGLQVEMVYAKLKGEIK
jgi:hypothetical protein